MSNPLEQFDPSIITGVLTEMLKKMVSEPYKEQEIEVTVKIPVPIIEGFEKVGKALGLDAKELLGNLASHGVQASLKDLTQVKQTNPPASGAPSSGGLDLKGMSMDIFGEEFAQLGGLMSKLQNVQEMVNNAAKSVGYEVDHNQVDSTCTNPKDPKKS